MRDEASEYSNPLASRYASRAMAHIFSDRYRFTAWRRLWIALARAERELGLPISQAQIEELEASVEDIDLERAAVLEAELRHDVMAHVHTWKEQCPEGGRILHLGATSCFVTDNSELIQIRAALQLLGRKLRAVIDALSKFCLDHAAQPTLGFTHFQPAQLTTVGKRAALWLQDFVIDHHEIEDIEKRLRFRGVKGTTGTQDSFLKLFDGDASKVERLDHRVAELMGFDRVFTITGQTYTRKQDSLVMNAVAGLAESGGKFSSDLRLLCHLQEIEEPFGSRQIGSSAMAYKRNPMRSERVAALSRFLLSLSLNAPLTASTQWFERTLDDSANRRLATSQAFLTADAILELLLNLTRGLVVRDEVIARHVDEALPFIASEEILMAAVKAGGDRQELHEVIRLASVKAQEKLKTEGGKNPFLELMGENPLLQSALEAMGGLDPAAFTGRCADQVKRFVEDEVEPLLAGRREHPLEDEVRV